MTRFVPLACVLWVASCSGPAPIPLGQAQSGIATFYDANGTGNCSFDATGDLDIAAMNEPQYANSASCGGCVKVEGPKGTVTVRIVDRCPECTSGHLDLSREAFAKIAELKDGRVNITWTPMACDVSGNLSYRFKEGSSQYWTAIQVRNHRLPITKLEFKKSGTWVEMPRQQYNYFLAEQGVGDDQVALRITASDGQQVEDTLPGVREAQIVSGESQFK